MTTMKNTAENTDRLPRPVARGALLAELEDLPGDESWRDLLRTEEVLSPLEIDPDEAVCGNCLHWMGHVASKQVEWLDGAGRLQEEWVAPCAVAAVDPDAGVAVVMLGERGHCQAHEAAFSPSREYCEACLEARIHPEAARGVVAGLDFPATLC